MLWYNIKNICTDESFIKHGTNILHLCFKYVRIHSLILFIHTYIYMSLKMKELFSVQSGSKKSHANNNFHTSSWKSWIYALHLACLCKISRLWPSLLWPFCPITQKWRKRPECVFVVWIQPDYQIKIVYWPVISRDKSLLGRCFSEPVVVYLILLILTIIVTILKCTTVRLKNGSIFLLSTKLVIFLHL